MDEKRKLTPFEQAFYDYRRASDDMYFLREDINSRKERIDYQESEWRDRQQTRANALAELKRHMTPEAFAELTGADKAVTP